MANKIDIISKDDLDADTKKIFEDIENDGVPVFWTSTGGFASVKDALLEGLV